MLTQRTSSGYNVATSDITPTDGQVLTWNAATMTSVWTTPSGGGTPGGSDTQVQFNNAGAFGGSSSMTFNPTGFGGSEPILTLLSGSSTGSVLTQVIQCDQINGRLTTFTINAGFASSGIVLDGSSSSGMLLQTGDWVYNNNGTGTQVDDINKHIDLQSFGDVRLGDPNTYGNGTVFSVADVDQRATFNKKFVITDTGLLYLWNPVTSTYWSYTPGISGALVPADTGSGSLP